MVFVSVPSYVYAFLVQYFFCFKVQIWPLTASSLSDAGGSYFSWTMFHSLVPAILSLSFGTIAGLARFVRAELTESLTSEYMIFPPKGDAFAPRNKYALSIDFEEEPPFFRLSPTHYAATWLCDPRAPKVERPKIVEERIKQMKKKYGDEIKAALDKNAHGKTVRLGCTADNSTLFQTGDSFSFSAYSGSFPTARMNDGNAFPFTVSFSSMTSDSIEVNITAN